MKLLRVALAGCAVSAVFAAWASWEAGAYSSNWKRGIGSIEALPSGTRGQWSGWAAPAIRADASGADPLPLSSPGRGPLPYLPSRSRMLQANAPSTLGFTASEVFQMPSLYLAAAAVELGDVDGDGLLDVVVLAKPVRDAPNTVKTSIYVFRQNAQGGFETRLEILSPDAYAQIKLGDLDGDGDADIVVTTAGGLASYTYLPNGSFQFTYSVGYSADALGLLDVDLDGRLDAITRTIDTGATIRYGDGAGSFPTLASPMVISAGHHFAVGDVTSDGLPDIVAPNGSDSMLEVAPHQRIRGGVATRYAYEPSIYGTPPIALGDFNADGRKDVALAIAGDQAPFIQVRHQDAAGTLGAASGLSLPDRGVALASADMDGDMRDDLVVLYGLAPMKLGVLLQGAAGFAPVYSMDAVGFSAVGPAALALGDLNGDGCRDAVALSSDTVTLFAATCRRARVAEVCRTERTTTGLAAVHQSASGRVGIRTGAVLRTAPEDVRRGTTRPIP